MTIRPIRELGDPVLRTPADEVRAFDKELAALVRDLEETVDHPGRAGLAAPQIGVSARVFSYNVDGVIGHLVNPRVAELSDEVQDGDVVARGLVAYDAREMPHLLGRKTGDLAPEHRREVVHRDEMVLVGHRIPG